MYHTFSNWWESRPLDIIRCWNDLARVMRLCGEHIQARETGEEVCEYGLRVLGEAHPYTLQAFRDLSITLRLNGDHDSSLSLAEKT